MGEALLDNTAHKGTGNVDENIMTLPMETESLRSFQSGSSDDVLNTVHYKPPKIREDEIDKRTNLTKLHDTKKDWSGEVQLSENSNAW